MPTISVIIITKNEANRIEACLRSVTWADEIIIVDSGSTDNTLDICRQYTDRIFVMDWPGFGPQKNRALQKASGDWVLSIDADEQISDALREEILATVAHANCCAYSLLRFSSYLGKTLHHGDWANDRCVRLFQRTAAYFSNDIVHERLIVSDGIIGKLHQPLYHQSFTSLEQVLEKVNSYSSLTAQMRYAQGKRSTLGKALVHGLWTFFRGYVLKRGFLDGREGFMLAVSNAEGTYYRYVKMMYQKVL